MTTTPTFWRTSTKATDNVANGATAVANGGTGEAREVLQSMVALDNGGFILFWDDGRSSQAQVFDAEGHVTATHLISAYWPNSGVSGTFGRSRDLPVIELKNGDIVVGLDGYNVAPNHDEWSVAHFSSDGSLKAIRTVATSFQDGENDKADLQLIALADGGYLLAFEEQDTDLDLLSMQRFDANGVAQTLSGGAANYDSGAYPTYDETAKTDEVRASYDLDAAQDQGQVAGLTGGGFATAWTELDGTYDLLVRIFDASGDAIEAVAGSVANPDREFAIVEGLASIEMLQVDALTGGGFVVSWIALGGDTYNKNFFAIISADGTFLKPVTQVEPNGGFTAVNPTHVIIPDQNSRSVLPLDDGGFLLLRQELLYDGTATRDLVFERFDASGNSLSGPVIVFSSAIAPLLALPSAIELADGTLLLAWSDTDADTYKAARFDLDGNMIGTEFEPLTTGNPITTSRSPALSLLEDGRVLVSVQDGSTETFVSILDPRDDVINGDDNNNTITARQDGARLNGRDGDDVLLGQGDDDLLFGQGGEDRLLGRRGDDLLDGGAHADTLIGHGGKDELRGGNGSDFLSGGGGTDELRGGSGADTLVGGGGNDILLGGGGSDELIGGSHQDTLRGGGGGDLLQGAGGRDTLFGDGSDDVLEGGGGNDTLKGGKGDDVLEGGSGRDRFVFDKRDGSDRIKDFRPNDKFDLTGMGFASKAEALDHFFEKGKDDNDVFGFSAKGTEVRIIGADLGDIDGSNILI